MNLQKLNAACRPTPVLAKQILPQDNSTSRHTLAHGASDRRGISAVFGIVLCASIFVVLAVVSDLAMINSSRTEMNRSADSSALAAAWELYEARSEGGSGIEGRVRSAAGHYSFANAIANQTPDVGQFDGAVEIGIYQPDLDEFIPTTAFDQADAVRVHLRMINAAHGEVPLNFGGLTGRPSQPLQTTSIAAFNRHISGFETPPDEGRCIDILPIALDLETWQAMSSGSTDDRYRYVDGQVTSGSDGITECSLYPVGNGSPGNRGTVDIGSANNSTSDLRRQIQYGISAADFAALGKPLEFDQNGELSLNGDTGISAGIKSQLAAIIGEKRIIPIFSRVHGNGNNAMYTIVAFEGVRILDVKLTGPMRKKHLTIQPAPMVARGVKLATSGTSQSSFLFTPAMLMQ